MSNKTVIEMARECLLVSDDGTEESAEYLEAIKRFAALVREDERSLQHTMDYNQGFVDGVEEGRAEIEAAVLAEREACAKVCKLVAADLYADSVTANKCAAAIRARGEK